MISLEDVTYTLASQVPNENGISVAFGIDGEIVHIMNTYVNFYDLMTSGVEVVDAEAPDEYVLHFKKDGQIIETLSCSELLHALLQSDPVIIELLRQPLPPRESLGDLRYVAVGWRYDANNSVYPPEGWARPVVKEYTEEQKAKLIELGHNV
jgi:hypothetical protein